MSAAIPLGLLGARFAVLAGAPRLEQVMTGLTGTAPLARGARRRLDGALQVCGAGVH